MKKGAVVKGERFYGHVYRGLEISRTLWHPSGARGGAHRRALSGSGTVP